MRDKNKDPDSQGDNLNPTERSCSYVKVRSPRRAGSRPTGPGRRGQDVAAGPPAASDGADLTHPEWQGRVLAALTKCGQPKATPRRVPCPALSPETSTCSELHLGQRVSAL